MTRLILFVLLCLETVLALQIGFFSQTFFNMTKAENSDTLDFLARVFEKYDLAGFNMVTDPDAVDVLLENLQRRNQNFMAKVSPLMSRPAIPLVPTLKESFGFFYKKHLVSLIGHIIRDEPTSAVSAKFKILTNNKEFVFSILHLIATDEEHQLSLLPAAYERISKDFDNQNVLFGGDFNTAERFISEEHYMRATVSQDPRFHWFIDFDKITIDTQALSGAVNRFLTAGGDIENWVVPGSDTIINTTDYYGLNENQLWATSVFYPIGIELRETGILPPVN